MSHLMTKPTKWHVRTTKTQISLGIRPVWSEYSLCAQWVAKDPRFLHADSEDSDQTGRMPRLSWVFAGCTVILLVLSWGGSCKISKDLVFLNLKTIGCNCLKHTRSTNRLLKRMGCELQVIWTGVAFKILIWTCLRGLRPGNTQTGLRSHRE